MKTRHLASAAILAALGFGTAWAQPAPTPPPPPHAAGTPDEVQMLIQRGHTGMVPGMQAGTAHDMGAGRPPTPMPPGSIANQAPGMGGPRALPR
jgi:hypothetical protein